MGRSACSFFPSVRSPAAFFSEFISWRWIFWINPPIVAVIALAVLAAWRDPPRAGPAVNFDVPGLIALVAGLGMFVSAIMQGPDWGWSNPAVWLLLAAGAAVLIVFVVIEWRTRQPLIDVALFRNGAFTTFNLAIFVAQFSKIAVFVFVALYFRTCSVTARWSPAPPCWRRPYRR